MMLEGDRIPEQLYCLITGKLEIKKTADKGKETIEVNPCQGEPCFLLSANEGELNHPI